MLCSWIGLCRVGVEAWADQFECLTGTNGDDCLRNIGQPCTDGIGERRCTSTVGEGERFCRAGEHLLVAPTRCCSGEEHMFFLVFIGGDVDPLTLEAPRNCEDTWPSHEVMPPRTGSNRE